MNGRYCILEKSRKATNSGKFFPLISAKQNAKRSNLETREEMVDRASERPGTGSVCTNTHTLSLVCPGEVAQTGSTNRKSVYDPPVLAGI